MRTNLEIEAAARQAARNTEDVNDCCPYPFATHAGQVYRRAFLDERAWLTKNINPTPGKTA